jgi:hypothetical protein
LQRILAGTVVLRLCLAYSVPSAGTAVAMLCCAAALQLLVVELLLRTMCRLVELAVQRERCATVKGLSGLVPWSEPTPFAAIKRQTPTAHLSETILS